MNEKINMNNPKKEAFAVGDDVEPTETMKKNKKPAKHTEWVYDAADSSGTVSQEVSEAEGNN